MDGPSCDSSDDDHPTALDAEVGVVHPINLSDPGAEEALYDIQSMRAFCGLELGHDEVPDETTILNLRHLLERHDLTKFQSSTARRSRPPSASRGLGNVTLDLVASAVSRRKVRPPQRAFS
jgi:Transposase domain (DUF772)